MTQIPCTALWISAPRLVNHVCIGLVLNKGKIVVQFCFTIIISGVGIQMTIYVLNKVHEMNVWLTNVCEEYPPSLAEGNKQVSFLK